MYKELLLPNNNNNNIKNIQYIIILILFLSITITNIIVYGFWNTNINLMLYSSLNYLAFLFAILIIFMILIYSYYIQKEKINIFGNWSYVLFQIKNSHKNILLILICGLCISLISILSNSLYILTNNMAFLSFGEFTLYWLLFTELLISPLLIIILFFTNTNSKYHSYIHIISTIIYTLSILILTFWIEYILQFKFRVYPNLSEVSYVLFLTSYVNLFIFIFLQFINSYLRCAGKNYRIFYVHSKFNTLSLINQMMFFLLTICIIILQCIRINNHLLPLH